MAHFEEAIVFYNILLQYTVREACQAVGTWEKAPSLAQITQTKFQKLFETVKYIMIYACLFAW